MSNARCTERERAHHTLVAKHTTVRGVVHAPELAVRIAYAVSPARDIVVAPTDGVTEVAAVDAVAADGRCG